MVAKSFDRVVRMGLTMGIGGFCLKESMYHVEEGHRAVVFDRKEGILKQTFGQGMHFRIPFWQYPVVLDIRPVPKEIHVHASTKDSQSLDLSTRVVSRPSEDHLAHIYAAYGADYHARIVPSLCHQVLQDVVAQHHAEDLRRSPDKVEDHFSSELRDRAKEFFLEVDHVAISTLTWRQPDHIAPNKASIFRR